MTVGMLCRGDSGTFCRGVVVSSFEVTVVSYVGVTVVRSVGVTVVRSVGVTVGILSQDGSDGVSFSVPYLVILSAAEGSQSVGREILRFALLSQDDSGGALSR